MFEIRFLAERAGPPCSRCAMQTAFQSSATGGYRPVKRCVFASLDGAPLCAPCLTPRERERLATYLSGLVDGINFPEQDAERRALTVAQFRDAIESRLLADGVVRGFSRATASRRLDQPRQPVAVVAGVASTADINPRSEQE